MKFACTRENLAYSLDTVSSLASKQNNLPILFNILIKVGDTGVELSATNLEVAANSKLRAKVEKQGSFTVPAKTLSDYVHLLTGENVDVTLEGNELHIVCGSSSTKIKGSPADDFPVIPDIEEKHSYLVNVDALRKGIIRAVVSVARNEIRPELSGVFFHFFGERFPGLILAATDSYRLSEARVPISQGEDRDLRCIVPARVVYEMARLLQLARGRGAEDGVRLWISENQIAIRYDNFELISRLIEGNYPDYAQIIPVAFKTKTQLPIDVLVNKIKAASLFTTTGVNAVSFDLNASENTVAVSSTSTQTGEHTSEIEAPVEGEENSILLNHKYLLDGLQHMESEEVKFSMNSADAPCLFQPEEKDDFIYIVMPIRQ